MLIGTKSKKAITGIPGDPGDLDVRAYFPKDDKTCFIRIERASTVRGIFTFEIANNV